MTDDRHFSFTKVRVADVDAAFAFYSGVFGRVAQRRVTQGEGQDALDEIITAPGAGDGPTLVLLRYVNRPVPAAGSCVVGFVVGDLDATLDAVVTHGGTVTEKPRSMPEHGIRVAFAADLDGHVLELVQLER